MPIFTELLPLSLYIHLPWCVRKCPYCDFNSHELKTNLPEEVYVAALLQDLDYFLPLVTNRPLVSIFFGGGTPSLFSAQAIAQILDGVAKRFHLQTTIEITLEANPGTIDQDRFRGFYHAGVNRLSLGVQSLQDEKLNILGRIHGREQALQAMARVGEAGFSNWNVDVMYGLPHQSVDEALLDIETALAFKPTHFSWYQLTLEPNTLFYHQPPPLPEEDHIIQMQTMGQVLLHESGFHQYEVSAYAQPKKPCVHNLNYWEFGDYLGIGAGAHSKITDFKNNVVTRFAQVKHPRDYLDQNKRASRQINVLTEKDLIFEFMLNALRLTEGAPLSLFTQRTGLSTDDMTAILSDAKKRGLMMDDPLRLQPSALGKQFLNDLMQQFLS